MDSVSYKITSRLYKIGDAVPKKGTYICVPCGYTQLFEEGEFFTTCEACFAGTNLGPAGYTNPDVEFWEFLG